jgi:hypothetical protein
MNASRVMSDVATIWILRMGLSLRIFKSFRPNAEAPAPRGLLLDGACAVMTGRI